MSELSTGTPATSGEVAGAPMSLWGGRFSGGPAEALAVLSEARP